MLGDFHAGQTDDVVYDTTKGLINHIKPHQIILHDFFDGCSISHHTAPFPLKMAVKAIEGKYSLLEELKLGAVYINDLSPLVEKMVFTKGNHDEFLERYLESGRYVNDPHNHYIALDLAKAYLEKKDVLAWAYANLVTLDEIEKCIVVPRDVEYKFGGIEIGQHGDLGLNGSKGSLNGIEKAYGLAVVGHAHTAAIQRGVYRVGTMTGLSLDYTKGPGSWTHTHCVVYSDGSRQLIHILDGEYCL